MARVRIREEQATAGRPAVDERQTDLIEHMDPAIEKLVEVMPSGCSATIAMTFRFMAIAEEEIKRAKLPDNGKRVFLATCPSTPLRGKAEALYWHHVREMIKRSHMPNADARTATEAEMLALVLDTSLIAPLSNGAMALAEFLFERVFGKLPRNAKRTDETWIGQIEETLRDVRAKAAQPDRKWGGQ